MVNDRKAASQVKPYSQKNACLPDCPKSEAQKRYKTRIAGNKKITNLSCKPMIKPYSSVDC
jgi:hypothetical protein